LSRKSSAGVLDLCLSEVKRQCRAKEKKKQKEECLLPGIVLWNYVENAPRLFDLIGLILSLMQMKPWQISYLVTCKKEKPSGE
jgi:hypothetical protein